MIISLGLCLKNVSKLIDAFVTSSIYFDVQKFPYLFENIYISNQKTHQTNPMTPWDFLKVPVDPFGVLDPLGPPLGLPKHVP